MNSSKKKKNHSIQFPGFSWSMQTMQQDQNKASFMTIKEYPQQNSKLLVVQFSVPPSSYSWKTLQWRKVNLYPESVLPKKLFFLCVFPPNFNVRSVDLPFFLPHGGDKFYPYPGPLNWESRVATGFEKQVEIFHATSLECLVQRRI